jgi:hypothetical protein
MVVILPLRLAYIRFAAAANKKGPRRAMAGRSPGEPVQGRWDRVRTFTSTVIILRNMLSARTFIARVIGAFAPAVKA